MIKRWFSLAFGAATSGSGLLWLAGAIAAVILSGWAYYALTTANLRTDVAKEQVKTGAVKVQLGQATDANHQMGAAVDAQNAAVTEISEKCAQNGAKANSAALGVLSDADASRRAEEADPTTGAARMNKFLKQNFGD